MDLHDRFSDWLADGADGEPPRDLALHASTCDDCMRAVAVVESLQAIDVGAAALPPAQVGSGRRPFAVARIAIGMLAVILLVVSVAIGASGLLRGTPAASDGPSASPAGRVLAGAPSADARDRSPSPTPTASPTRSPTPSPSATESVATEPTAAPPQPQPPPRTAAPQPPPPTVAPPAPEPTAPPPPPPTQPPPPSGSAVPPSPTPSPSPTPTLPLPECSNGLDDDGDTLIDFGVLPANDPECTGPLDDSEAS